MGISFALQIRITVCMVLGAHCCSYSGVGVALVNLQVALVFGYGRGSCHLDFCRGCWFPGSAAGQGVGPPSLCGVSSFLPGGRFHSSS